MSAPDDRTPWVPLAGALAGAAAVGYMLPGLAAAWRALRAPLGIEDRTASGQGYALTFDDYSVDTTSCFPPSAVCNVCQARVAHLTLAGNSETPENTVNFPSPD